MGPKNATKKKDVPRTLDVSQDLFLIQQKSVSVTLATVPLDYTMGSIIEGPPEMSGQGILQIIVSPFKLSVIPVDAVAEELEEQDQQHEEQEEEFSTEEEITEKEAGAQQNHVFLPRHMESQQGEWLQENPFLYDKEENE